MKYYKGNLFCNISQARRMPGDLEDRLNELLRVLENRLRAAAGKIRRTNRDLSHEAIRAARGLRDARKRVCRIEKPEKEAASALRETIDVFSYLDAQLEEKQRLIESSAHFATIPLCWPRDESGTPITPDEAYRVVKDITAKNFVEFDKLRCFSLCGAGLCFKPSHDEVRIRAERLLREGVSSKVEVGKILCSCAVLDWTVGTPDVASQLPTAEEIEKACKACEELGAAAAARFVETEFLLIVVQSFVGSAMALAVLTVVFPYLAWIFIPIAIGAIALAKLTLDPTLSVYEDGVNTASDYIECINEAPGANASACESEIDSYIDSWNYVQNTTQDAISEVRDLGAEDIPQEGWAAFILAGGYLTIMQIAVAVQLGRLNALRSCVKESCAEALEEARSNG